MIYDILTETNGLMSVIAKGVKKKKDGLSMQPFKELQLTFTKSSLPLLTKHDILTSYGNVYKSYMLEGLYFNELIYKFIPRNEPLPSLFSLYKNHLSYMNDGKHESWLILLRFEFFFLKEIGYQLNHAYLENYTVNPNILYFYEYGSGFKEAKNINNNNIITISGKCLSNLLEKKFNQIIDIKNTRLIIKKIIKQILGDKDIKSYDILS
jgi:DNA repair protein RecO (recombination protein O)